MDIRHDNPILNRQITDYLTDEPADFTVEIVLAAPRRAASVKDAVLFANDRLIVIDHGDGITEHLTPKTGVRGLAGTAGGTKEIGFAVYGKGRAVHQKAVIGKKLCADVTVNRKVFAVRSGEVFV